MVRQRTHPGDPLKYLFIADETWGIIHQMDTTLTINPAEIRARSAQYFKDVVVLKPQEAVAYLRACYKEAGKNWPGHLSDSISILERLLSCQRVMQISRETGISRWTIYKRRSALLRQVGVPLEPKTYIEPDDCAMLLAGQMLKNASIPHPKIMLLYHPPKSCDLTARKTYRAALRTHLHERGIRG